MSDKMINRLVALTVFLISAFVYIKTLSVTVVFWDVGEFCAASWLMQVPHPPGSPLFLLLARVVSMVPFFDDIAARMHAISAISSALGIMFLYLVSVKVLSSFRGGTKNAIDRLMVYGASAIGALTLAFSTTYWDNAIEAEVYGLSMLFVTAILWLAMRWWERSEEAHSETYIILIAYLIGLSTGVHLLAVLAVFPVMMLIYFKRYELNRSTFIRFLVATVAAFFFIYPGVVKYLPSMLDGDFMGVKSEMWPLIPIAATIAALYGTFKSKRTGHKIVYVACVSFLFIVLGYTTYYGVLIRANVPNIPMNENDPSNIERLVSYLGREQYGDTPILKGDSWDNDLQDYREKLFPRRHSREAMHEQTRVNYTSDADFLWRYQSNHMFFRYVFWNFIGAEGDWQDAGVGWSDTWGIPFFLGLIGLYYSFRKDWKFASVFLVIFIIMGIVLALYQNQQQPQPRERDYFYVGAYYVFALWIAVGIYGIIELLLSLLKGAGSAKWMAFAVLCITLVAGPVNLLRANWFEHDRSKNYAAWDYSYNLLQSVEKDGILFTNGDNDTFPLWYLQDVEGVRRDVRIVNLSLVNTNWYISQLKNQRPHGAEKVPISLTDAQIERIQPIAWKPRMVDLPVPHDVAKEFGVTDTSVLNRGKITFEMKGVPFTNDIRILRTQDIMVRDIVMTNQWKRPIFFAVTVSPDSKIGLDNYMWMHGLTYKLTPVYASGPDGGLVDSIMYENVMASKDIPGVAGQSDTIRNTREMVGLVKPSTLPQRGYRYRELNNPDVYYDENAQRMIMNYRVSFMRLAEYEARVNGNRNKAKAIMASMDDLLPVSILPVRDWRFSEQVMEIFRGLGDLDRFEHYANDIEQKCWAVIDDPTADISGYFNPFRPLMSIYDTRKDYANVVRLLKKAQERYPNDPNLKPQIDRYQSLLNQSASGSQGVPSPGK
jgi:hypothetical protein